MLEHAAAAFAALLPATSPATLAGAQPGAIADRIGQHFHFRGGGYAVDTAHASSLVAVATACALLAAGELDFVLAGGVDISLDPFELSGLALAGVLASGAMRIYDTNPTGFLPGEGCGMVALMRADDADRGRHAAVCGHRGLGHLVGGPLRPRPRRRGHPAAGAAACLPASPGRSGGHPAHRG